MFSVTSMLSSTSLDFPGGNLTRCRGYVGFTQQAIHHSRRAVLVRIISRIRKTEKSCARWPAEIAVDQEHAITLLSQCKRIIRAGETLSLVRHSAGEKRNLSLGFRAQKRKCSAQIAERFRRRTFRSFDHDAIVRTSESSSLRRFRRLTGPSSVVSGTAAKTGRPSVFSAWSTVLIERSNASTPKTKAKPTARPPSKPRRIVLVGRGLTGEFWKRGMLNHTDRIRLDVFCQVRVFYLAKNAFVQRTIGFGLPRQFLIANRCAI